MMSQTACDMSSSLGENIPGYIIVIISYIDYILPGFFPVALCLPEGIGTPTSTHSLDNSPSPSRTLASSFSTVTSAQQRDEQSGHSQEALSSNNKGPLKRLLDSMNINVSFTLIHFLFMQQDGCALSSPFSLSSASKIRY